MCPRSHRIGYVQKLATLCVDTGSPYICDKMAGFEPLDQSYANDEPGSEEENACMAGVDDSQRGGGGDAGVVDDNRLDSGHDDVGGGGGGYQASDSDEDDSDSDDDDDGLERGGGSDGKTGTRGSRKRGKKQREVARAAIILFRYSK